MTDKQLLNFIRKKIKEEPNVNKFIKQFIKYLI